MQLVQRRAEHGSALHGTNLLHSVSFCSAVGWVISTVITSTETFTMVVVWWCIKVGRGLHDVFAVDLAWGLNSHTVADCWAKQRT